MQGRNRDADVKNEHVEKGQKGRVIQPERVALTYTLTADSRCCRTQTIKIQSSDYTSIKK